MMRLNFKVPHTRITWLLAALTILQTVSGVFSQQPAPSPTPPPLPSARQKPESDEVVRITTNLVQVDAVITDKNGKVVTDLKPEEIQISEDGKQQKITDFSFVAIETPPLPASESKPEKAGAEVVPIIPSQLKPE